MPSARFFAFATLATSLALCVLVSSQHRIRLIAGDFDTVDSLAHLSAAESFTYMAPVTNSGPSFDSVVRELALFDVSHPLHDGAPVPVLDQPDTCERVLREGKLIHCYNADIGVCSLLAREQVRARLWDITGPKQLGANGHNLLEVYDNPSHSWLALDPYYHCYFTLVSDSLKPLSVPQLRLALLEALPTVRMITYATVPGARRDSIVIEELRELAPCAILHANNDFQARYEHRYAWLMPLAPLIDRLPLRISRGVRTFMMGTDDRRYVIEDRLSPHYPFLVVKWSFRGLALLFGTFFILGVLRIRQEERKNPNAISRRR